MSKENVVMLVILKSRHFINESKVWQKKAWINFSGGANRFVIMAFNVEINLVIAKYFHSQFLKIPQPEQFLNI